MRHKSGGRKLQRTSAHRTALFRNMSAALITHEQITTTVDKATELRTSIAKLVTRAKSGGLANRRREDRKSGVWGKSGAVRVALVSRRIIRHQKHITQITIRHY